LISDGGRGKRENEGVNPTKYIVSTYVNTTSYPLVKLLYANRKKKRKLSLKYMEQVLVLTQYTFNSTAKFLERKIL
jgi:hypothetical protein